MMDDGTVQHIAFALRSLSPVEECSQMDKEGLAVVCGVEKYQHLFGRQFALYTNHKPLMHLFSSKHPSPPPPPPPPIAAVAVNAVNVWVVCACITVCTVADGTRSRAHPSDVIPDTALTLLKRCSAGH